MPQDFELESLSRRGDHSQKVKAPLLENDYGSKGCSNLQSSTAFFRLNTLIVRHRKENVKKCSVEPLNGKEGFEFITYPFTKDLDLSRYVVIALGGDKILSPDDKGKGLLFLDSTWRYVSRMEAALEIRGGAFEKRSLPASYVTAYPRTQEDCEDPSRGLATIEAIYIAYTLLGHSTEGLLDAYYWKEPFLTKNKFDLETKL